jgi:parallel beta-helix repeat protein
MSLILKTINRYIVQRSVIGIPVGVPLPTAPVDVIYAHPTIAALIAAPIPAATNVSKLVLGRDNAGDCEMPIYRWDTSSTAVHDGALVVKPGSISAGNPGRYLAIHNNVINCRWYGAKGDDTADDAGPMQNALNGAVGKTLAIPKGIYLLYQLVVPSQTRIKAENGAVIHFVGPNCFICNSINGFSVDGLTFQGDNAQVAVFAGRSQNITIKNCKASSRLFAGSLELPYASVTDADLNRNIKILNNECYGSNKAVGDAAIYFIYCNEAVAKLNTIKTYAHGISWWGGNAKVDIDGAETNPRKTKNIRISNNFITDIGHPGQSGGGIWGSMGDNVIVSNNQVSECTDVGIDFEGTWAGVAIGNTVKNCTNGCLATFFLNRRITFSHNTVEVSNPSHPLWRNYNVSQEGSKNKDFLFEGNQFTCLGTAVGVFDSNSGPCSDLVIKNNKFKNVYIDIDSNNQGATTIEGNEIKATIQANSRAPIKVANLIGSQEILKIENNTIVSYAAQPLASAISVDHRNPNQEQTSIIKNNYCQGFAVDIACVLTTSNAALSGKYIIHDNIGTAGIITVDRAINAGAAPTVLKARNMKIDGTPS